MLARLSSEESAREDAITLGTHAKLDRIWDIWELFLQRVKLKEDSFPENISSEDGSTIIRSFSVVVRERYFSRKGKINLDQITTKESMDKLAEVLRGGDMNNPRNGIDGKQDLQLKLKLRGYINKDPETKQEKSFTPFFLFQLFHRSITDMRLSISNLAALGLFSAMKSCEYAKATKGERKTHLIRLRNIEFWVVHHKRMELINPETFQYQAVSLTFEDQNNGNKIDRNTQ